MVPGFPAQVIADARVAAKDYARITLTQEDVGIAALVAAALAMGEAFLGTALIAREHVEILPVHGGWQRLAATPVTAITSVRGLPAEGASFELPVGGYAIDIDAAGDGWVRVIDAGIAGRIEVKCSAGIATGWAGVPAPIAHGVVRLIAHLHGERDGANGPPPAAVTALWRPFRRVRLMEASR